MVQFYALHQGSDFIFLGFELCLGSLAAALALDGRAPAAPLAAFAERLRWPGGRAGVLREVAVALAEVHAEGVSHNDLHAGNVLVVHYGTVKLHDLQLSKEVAPNAAGHQFFSFNTFANAGLQINRSGRAPEILAEVPKLTEKVDVWALGVLAYQILTGRASPFEPAPGPPPPMSDPRALGPVAQEDFNIRRGKFDLSAVAAPPLSRRESLEARDLIAACLQVAPAARPSAAAFLRHPLFWDPGTAMEAVRTLRKRDLTEAGLREALEAKGAGALYAALRDWQDRVHPPLLAALRAKSGYGAGLGQLLRFARNGHEHPPPCADAFLRRPAAGLDPGAVEEARQEAVAGYLVEAFPELPLCVHVALEGEGPGQGG